MSIVLKDKPSRQVPAGVHIAICYRIVRIGTQPDTGFGERAKIIFFWELPQEVFEFDGKIRPMGISRIYTESLNKKASLRKDIAAWRGRDFTKEELEGFDVAKVLGRGCQLQISHNDEGRANIAAIMALPKGSTVSLPFNAMVEYSIDEGRGAKFEALPEWVRNMCLQCAEWTGRTEPVTEDEQASAAQVDAADMPF